MKPYQGSDSSDIIRYFEIRYPKSMEKLYGVMVTPVRSGMRITEIPSDRIIIPSESESESSSDFLS